MSDREPGKTLLQFFSNDHYANNVCDGLYALLVVIFLKDYIFMKFKLRLGG